MEYFHDHARIEDELFTGSQLLRDGMLKPLADKPGMGLVLREDVAARYQVAA